MGGEFKRSSRFGIVGVFVVAAACVAIGLTLGDGQANPKLALGLIFAVLAVFVVTLLALQRADLARAARGDAEGSARGAAEGGRRIENPTPLGEAELWAAMAVRPIDREALAAREAMWAAGRRSLRLGALIVALIFLTVPSIYLLESFVPLLIGGPLIVAAALWGAIRAVGAGGEMERGYGSVEAAMAPLGLSVEQRPTVAIEMRDPATPRIGPRVDGELVLGGERHGRRVAVRLGGGETGGRSEVAVAAPGEESWTARSRDGRVRPSEGAPAAVREALAAVPNSVRWRKVEMSGGAEGIVVTRKGGERGDWLCDLWLAERLADA